MSEGLEGCVCLIDDVLILIHGKDHEEHEKRLKAVLTRLTDKGVMLNPQKCEFEKSSLKLLDHILNEEGVHPDPHKTDAIQKM